MKKIYHITTWLQIAIQAIAPFLFSVSPAVHSAVNSEHDRNETFFETDRDRIVAERLRQASPIKGEFSAGEQQAAALASQAGSGLTGSQQSHALKSMANSMLMNRASQEVQQWLSKIGSARVQLQGDGALSLKNSQIDLLVPFYDRPDSLIFTQGSMHRTDNRFQANLGLGGRYFIDQQMFGSNLFIDQDFSDAHSRAGVGIEYWRDNLKLSANGYLRLTGWKKARGLEDYEERAANGWDVRFEGWLPAYPQLGAKLTYEQYYGKEVALFDKESRQRDPHAITVGMNWTPIPLITLGMERRQGESGKNDNRLALQLNYQMGQSWKSLTDSSQVKAMRSLKGSRYDLVDRNNNIVLEYRKKELIKMRMPAQLQGFAGEIKMLIPVVTSKYGLDHIEWYADALLANGGRITTQGPGSYQLQLPAYQHQSKQNHYLLEAVAVDKKGNVSERAQTVVDVNSAAINIGKSTLTPADIQLPADGKSTQLLTLAVKDEVGQPVDVQENEIVLKSTVAQRSRQSSKVDTFKRQAPGIYTALVTAGTREEKIIVTPSARNVTFTPATITMIPDSKSARISALKVVKDNALADGVAKNSISVSVEDATGLVVEGQTVNFSAEAGMTVAQSAVTDKQGQLVVPVTSTHAGSGTIIASLADGKQVKATLTFRAGEIATDRSTFTVSPNVFIAGKDTVTVQVVLQDEHGNKITGSADNIGVALPEALQLTLTPFTESAPGIYQSSLSGKKSGTAKLSATFKEQRVGGEQSIVVHANKETAKLSGKVAVTPGSAIVGQTVTYTATFVDANDNPLDSGYAVHWDANNDSQLSATDTLTTTGGQTSATLTRNQVGTAQVSLLTLAGKFTAPDVVFGPSAVDESLSGMLLTTAQIVAGKSTAKFYLSVKDGNGNPLSGQQVTGVADRTGVSFSPAHEMEGRKGTYVMDVSGSLASDYNLSVKVNGKTFNKTLPLTVTADVDSWTIDKPVATKTSIEAGEAEGITWSARVRDGFGNPLPHAVVTWRLLEGQADVFANSVRTDDQGVASTTLTTHVAGRLVMEASLDGEHKQTADVVTVTPAAIDVSRSTFSSDKTVLGADGIELATLTAQLTDHWGNTIKGKTVSVSKSGSASANLMLSSATMNDNGDGNYQTTAKAISQGEVSLKAMVDGKQVGKTVNITVGAAIPELKFANATQSTTWTRSYDKSQQVEGVPDGVKQHWSSSDESVATVSDSGQVMLFKAGEVTIYVTTDGNGQFQPATASYKLKIERAQPLLRAASSSLSDTWNSHAVDEVSYSFANADVGSELKPTFSSSESGVVTVDKDSGKLTPVKPGQATLTIETPETDRFLADSQTITYMLAKANPEIEFATSLVKTTDTSALTVQKPVKEIAEDAHAVWSSGNNQVVIISPEGIISSINKGQTQLTLSVAGNDYYQAGSGQYTVEVYSKPNISLGQMIYTGNGNSSSTGTWYPTYIDDNMKLSWSVISSVEYDKPRSVTVTLKDKNGATLDTKTYDKPTGSITTEFAAKMTYWGKELHIEVLAKGYSDEAEQQDKQQTSVVKTDSVTPDKLGTSTTTYRIVHIKTNNGELDSGCQASYLGTTHHVSLWPVSSIALGRQSTLLSEVKVHVQIVNPKGDTQRATDYGTRSSRESGQLLASEEKSHTLAMKEECWTSHIGGGELKTTLTFNNKESSSVQSFVWSG